LGCLHDHQLGCGRSGNVVTFHHADPAQQGIGVATYEYDPSLDPLELARMHHSFPSQAHPLFALPEGEKATSSRLARIFHTRFDFARFFWLETRKR